MAAITPSTDSGAQALRNAANVEREAQQRVANARKVVENAEKEAKIEADRVRDQYARATLAQAERSEAALIKERDEGYEHLREVQRQNRKEIQSATTGGEQSRAELESELNRLIAETEQKGSDKIHETTLKTHIQTETERKLHEERFALEKQQHEAAEQAARDRHEFKLRDAERQHLQEYAKNQELMQASKVRETAHFDEQYGTLTAQHDKILADLYDRTSRSLDHTRRAHTTRLDAYSERKNDPFYSVVKTDAKLSDKSEFYELSATIPAHEQAGVSVSVQGNQLVLSGIRRSQDTYIDSPGLERATSTYQTYRESFTLPDAVDKGQLNTIFEGDKLTIVVPKKGATKFGGYSDLFPKAPKPNTAPLQAGRPRFPGEIDQISTAPDKTSGEGSAQAATKDPKRGWKPIA